MECSNISFDNTAVIEFLGSTIGNKIYPGRIKSRLNAVNAFSHFFFLFYYLINPEGYRSEVLRVILCGCDTFCPDFGRGVD
jgi:hypothetical protein